MSDESGIDPRLKAHLEKYPFGEQDENGIDLTLLRENLKLTPTERYEKHRRALLFVREVRRARPAD